MRFPQSLSVPINSIKSSKNLSCNVAVNVGQAIVADWNADCQPLMAIRKQMQQRGV